MQGYFTHIHLGTMVKVKADYIIWIRKHERNLFVKFIAKTDRKQHKRICIVNQCPF